MENTPERPDGSEQINAVVRSAGDKILRHVGSIENYADCEFDLGTLRTFGMIKNEVKNLYRIIENNRCKWNKLGDNGKGQTLFEASCKIRFPLITEEEIDNYIFCPNCGGQVEIDSNN